MGIESSEGSGSAGPIYDRQLLLADAKRNHELDLSEVHRYGSDSYNNPDYVCLYGMAPADWYAKGIRLLGRTAVECTRDELADAIGQDVAAVAKTAPAAATLVLDPFAGSGNTLYWMLRHLPGASSLGFELDPMVFQLAQHNLTALNLPIHIENRDYASALVDVPAPVDGLTIAFIAPPWGAALHKTNGLDLRCTTPPIAAIVDCLIGWLQGHLLLCAIQIYEKVDSASLTELSSRFSWSKQRVYNLNAPGQNHGILVGACGWRPPNGFDWRTCSPSTE